MDSIAVQFKGIPELTQALTEIPEGRCEVTGSTASALSLKITLVANEVVLVSSDPTNAAILVNLAQCSGTIGSTTVYPTRTNLRTLEIVGDDTGSEVVVLDYINGVFAMGSNTGTHGTFIDLDGGAEDSVKIRMTTGVDKPLCGQNTGDNVCKVNTDAFPDLKDLTGVDDMVWSLGPGADTFSGAGDAHTGNTPIDIDLTIYGGDGNDVLRGGDGDDTLFGGDGNDTLHAEDNKNSKDTFYGGEPEFDENDVPVFYDEEENPIPSGVDTVTYASRSAALSVTIGDDINEGGDALEEANDGEEDEEDRVMDDVNNLIGGSGDDILKGNSLNNTITGGEGDDVIAGGDGNDILNGGNGDDFFDEGDEKNGSDIFNGGTGRDIVDYGRRTNALTITMLSGANDGEEGENDDVKSDIEGVFGGAGSDNITGNNLNNIISGGKGNDTLNGLGGDDLFLQGYKDHGTDTINGGTGNGDTVDYSADYLDLLNSALEEESEDALEALEEGVTVVMGSENLVNIRRLIGSDEADDITGSSGNDFIDGRDGNDTIDAGAGDDLILGGLGDDDIDCGAGSDIAGSGGGDDTFKNCQIILPASPEPEEEEAPPEE